MRARSASARVELRAQPVELLVTRGGSGRGGGRTRARGAGRAQRRDAQVAPRRVDRRGQAVPREVRGRRRLHRDRQVGRHLRDVRRRSRLCFQVSKALGAKALSTEISLDETKRIGQFADRHQMPVGYHGHAATSAAMFENGVFRTRSTTSRISTSDTSRPARTPRPCRSSSGITLVSRTCTSRIGSSTTVRTCHSVRATRRSRKCCS